MHKRSRSKSGRSFSLHSDAELIREFEAFAQQLKAHIGKTFVFNQEDGEIGDFFFGALLHDRADPVVSERHAQWCRLMTTPYGLLCPQDPTFRTLKENVRTLNELVRLQFRIHPSAA